VLTVALSLCLLSGCLAAGAGAYATLAPPPSASSSTGLPDGRVYEEVSPANKHGFQAGATPPVQLSSALLAVRPEFSVASPDGNAVAFGSLGPAAETDSSGLNQAFVGERTSQGWISRASTPRGLGLNEKVDVFAQTPTWLDYSRDLSHLAYNTQGAGVQGAPEPGPANFYLTGPDPFAEPTWLLRGASKAAIEEKEILTGGTELVGMSPDASVVYIAYEGRLLAQDTSRLGWGLYEYRNGALSEVGVLPDGSVPPSGALPVATASKAFEAYNEGENNPASFDNQLSEDGMRLFFVSAGEIYVHEIEAGGGERSVLVSASRLPGHVGEAAPDGVSLFENLTQSVSTSSLSKNKSAPTYAYASPDGSHVFFQSVDQLTSQAPSGSEPKVYDFDVDTETLEYLPGVALRGIVTSAKDGSSFVFVDGASSPQELDLWSAGPNGGSVTQIAQLPGGGFVGPARMVSGDSVLVFQASAPIAGFNNAGAEQIYRYDIKANELGCVSCPPDGVRPSADAYLSAIDQYRNAFNISGPKFMAINDVRGVSSGGERIFFASHDPLVGRDTNGDYDTYEWENGTVFLLSSGTGADYSLFLDNSQSGGDVFFATSDELEQGDNDGAFDVYDARVPRPGDNPPPSAVPCSGDVCQGPPSVDQLLGAPPSATFDGAGNIVEEPPVAKAKSSPRRLSTRKLAGALRACRKHKSKHDRAVCERRARQRYRAAGAAARQDSGRGK
jgi:hypothetical protein